MFVTVVTVHEGRAVIQQIEAPTVKDCLVVWAGKVDVPGMTDEGRTRLRGHMADFEPSAGPLNNVWRLEPEFWPGRDGRATVVVVETVRR